MEVASEPPSVDDHLQNGADKIALSACFSSNFEEILHYKEEGGEKKSAQLGRSPTRSSRLLETLVEKPSRANMLLDTLPSVVILANALKIGLSADIDPSNAVWDVLEAFFICCFLFEALLKLKLWGCRKYFCGVDRAWNWFDFTCLVVSIADLFITYVVKFMVTGNNYQLLKFLRLARLARLVRALHFRFFDELRTMVLGVFSGVKVLFWAIILLLFVIFFLGVFMNSMVGDNEPEFETVPHSMFTVFRCYTDGCSAFNGTPLSARLFERYGGLFFVCYLLSFMLVTVGIFNLIMAIFIDNVVGASVHRKLEELGASAIAVEQNLKDTIAQIVTNADRESNGFGNGAMSTVSSGTSKPRFSELRNTEVIITRDMFAQMLENPSMQNMLDHADIETSVKSDLFDVLDVDMGGELEMDELISGLMSLRGPITKTDIIAVKLKVRYITKMIEDMWRHQGFT